MWFHPGSCAHDHGCAGNDHRSARYYDTANNDHYGGTRHYGGAYYDNSSVGRHDRCRIDDGSSGHGDQPAPTSQADTGALPGGVHAGA
ncbi:MAG: hypothetical protein QGH55_05855 [Acidimicrobiales bacterium]|jgi:hypothetical protein|nr:hypothetical protein [Acidimicrobiales bacterium]